MFGILNIVFFVLGLCGTIIPLSVVFVQQNPNAPSNPLIDLMQSSDAFKAFTVISAGLGLVGAIVLCFAGIGLLMMRNWGRLLSVYYAIYSIVTGLVAVAVSAYLIWLPLIQRAKGPAEVGGAVGGVTVGAGGTCVGMLYPIVLLVFMCRPGFVAALRSVHTPTDEHPAAG